MNKKLQLLGLLVVMLTTSFSAFAVGTYVDGLFYDLDNLNNKRTATVVYYSGYNFRYKGDITIPATIKTNGGFEYTVTAIGDGAFKDCNEVTSVSIPNTVTTIGKEAFEYCYSMTSVNIPESVTYIKENAFYRCMKLTSVTIPDSVTRIDGSAFYGCIGLTSLTISNSLTGIYQKVFYGCISLTSVTIPDSVTFISSGAFYNCESLTSITIGNSVKSIGKEAFCNCSNLLKVIMLPSSVPTIETDAFSDCNIKITYVDNDNYKNMSKLGTIKVYPYLQSMFDVDGVRYVPVVPSQRTCDVIDCDYSGKFSDFVIPEAVLYKKVNFYPQIVNDYSFAYNDYLVNVSLSNNGDVGSSCFFNCTNLSSATINGEVSAIGNYAFYGCSGLTSLTLGNSVTSIGEYAFAGSAITEFPFPSELTTLGKYTFENCKGIKSVTINGKLGELSEGLFAGCSSLSGISIPTNIKSVGNNAFNDCTSLASLIIEDGTDVLELGNKGNSPLFADCPLEKVYIGTHINYNTSFDYGYSPFYGNTSLRTVQLSHNVSEVYDNEFNGCIGLESATINGEVSAIGNYAFYGCSGFTSLTIPDSVTSIGEYAFYGCSGLTSLTLGNSVTSIGEYAFAGSAITEFPFPSELITLGKYTFENCKGVKSVTISGKLGELSEGLFAGCSSLSGISIPTNIKSVGNNAFNDCTSLASLIIEDGTDVLELGNKGNSPLFADCPLEKVYIGTHINYNTSSDYGYSPFYGNTSLRTVQLSHNVSEVYDNEFNGCTGLESVVIGDKVTKIGKYAFSGCRSMGNFVFGTNVESIGNNAFYGCTALESLYAHSITPPTCGTDALSDIDKFNCTLYVSTSALSAYQMADQWKDFFLIEGKDLSGVGQIVCDDDSTVVGRYDINGRVMNEPFKGLNILKMSDGSTRKVWVE